MRATRYDVVVVGGGLAGASLALHLARGGFTVGLLEAHVFPRDKVCGEFLSPDALDPLRRLGLEQEVVASGAVPIRTVRVTAAGTEWRGTLPAAGCALSRARLDMLLLNQATAAGADTDVGAVVRAVEIRGSERTVRYVREGLSQQVTGRCVVGAYGRRRWSQGDGERRQALDGHVGFKGYFSGVDLEDAIELHAFVGGYCGLAPVEGDRINLCLQVATGVLRSVGGSFEQLRDRVMVGNPALARRFAQLTPLPGSMLAIAGVRSEVRSREEQGMWLVGDAGATITPLCGDGMAMALRSAELLAPLVARFLHGEVTREEATRLYERTCRAEFRSRLWVGRAIETALTRPGLARLALYLLERTPILGGTLIRWTRGAMQTS